MVIRGRHVIGVALVLLGAAASACGLRREIDSRNTVDRLHTPRDSVHEAGARLYTIVRTVDRVGRNAGSLPRTLAEIGGDPDVAAADPWGRAFRYSPIANRFEIRSAGRDGSFGSGDDIVATGRMGRAMPCEIRDEAQTTRFENVAPLCDAASTHTIFKMCPLLSRADRVETAVPATKRDSVLAMGRRLVRVARALDGYGREIGTLPLTLRGPVIWDRDPEGELPDLWGKPVRYTPAGTRFELRSAGPDRNHDSPDDIVLANELGVAIACQFQTAWGTLTCLDPPPDCD